ncbi:hypothetical protein [Streptomyces sp. NPDC054975]
MSSKTVRRWADGGKPAMERDRSGKRVIEGTALAPFAQERGAGLHAVLEDDVPTSVRNSLWRYAFRTRAGMPAISRPSPSGVAEAGDGG